MQGIVHIRIDDRLLHGQVVAFWSNSLQISRVMVINDEVANDELQKTFLRMVAPANIRTSILSKETAVKNILNEKYLGQKVMIIVKNPKDILDLIDLGLEIKEVNVGNMASRKGTIQIKRSVSITNDELENFLELENRGVLLTAMMVPDEGKNYLRDYLKKAIDIFSTKN
ncbi:PTS system mannose/fructose/N-acetylgalactosamine-transporter subunit IIB [Clostridium butyricum]|uniref:PTS sugar transporter subunit IIC n=1 Tax=Clostridium butyricum TaxID=1492 RepID=A0A2S7FFB8_CLOBU|nr:PTS sugar transporter subunit IIB [Clostridium butyricum]KHD15444.1 PTS sugar transporter subunit IIC [Clostridium butyricum]PPV17599.1 PTS sugar transporter subunit IIC [Clostridium butyricum]